MEQDSKKRFLIGFLYALALSTIVFVSLKIVLSYLLPFVFSGVIAFVVQKPAIKISSKIKLKKGTVAALLAAVIFIGFLFLMVFLVYRLFLTGKGFLSSLPEVLNYFISFVSETEKSLSALLLEISPELARQISSIFSDLLENLRHSLTEFFSSFAANIASKTPSFIFSGIVSLVASCYIAKDFDGLARFLRGIIGREKYQNILKIKGILTGSILKLLKGYLILTAITFIEMFIGFFVLGVDYPFILALIISFVDLLPVFGTGTVLIPWGLFSIISGDNALGFAIIILYILVTVLRNFLEPKIIGNQIGINPLFTLIAMFAGLKFFGFLGLMIFPVTLIVVIKYYKNEMLEEAEYDLSHKI